MAGVLHLQALQVGPKLELHRELLSALTSLFPNLPLVLRM